MRRQKAVLMTDRWSSRRRIGPYRGQAKGASSITRETEAAAASLHFVSSIPSEQNLAHAETLEIVITTPASS